MIKIDYTLQRILPSIHVFCERCVKIRNFEMILICESYNHLYQQAIGNYLKKKKNF